MNVPRRGSALVDRFLSPVYISSETISTCRFIPTCSEYALEAVSKYGVLKGGYLALRRLLRCHPFHRADTIRSPRAAILTCRHLVYRRQTDAYTEETTVQRP